ncbi:MAG: NAD(P)-dependent alcohol dehydrogenase [Acidimicrobiia bacterium]
MKAARLYEFDPQVRGPEFLRVEEVPEPQIAEPDDVIVRVRGAGVCRTDLHIVQGLWEDALVTDPPYIMGHENAGSVEEVGPGVERFGSGDPVVIAPGMTDGTCSRCREGLDNLCESLVWQGIQIDGGFAELLRTKERNLIRVPDGMEPRQAAPYADAGLTGYHAAKRAARVLTPDAWAVVIGVGGLGHVGIQALRALTPARIVAIDISEEALRLAGELGADEVVPANEDPVGRVLELTGGRGAEAVLDFVAEGDVPQQAFAMTRNGGTYLIIGYGGVLSVPTMAMIAGEKQIVGNLGGTFRELEELMSLARRGKVTLLTQEYPLAEVNQAMADLHHGRVRGRAVLIP